MKSSLARGAVRKLGLVLTALLIIGGIWILSPNPVRTPPAARPTGSTPSISTEGIRSEPASTPPIVAANDAAALVNEISRALRSGQASERDQAFAILLPRLLSQDADAAAQLALGWQPGPLREELMRQLITRWAAIDLGRTLTWLTGLRDQVERDQAAQAVTSQVGQGDPIGALELAELLRVGSDDGSLEHYAQLWTEENPRAAVAWIAGRPASPMRDQLLSRIAWVRAQTDPWEAADLTLNHLSAGPVRDDAIAGVVRQWAAHDLAGAESWVATFPPGPTQDRALQELATVRKIR